MNGERPFQATVLLGLLKRLEQFGFRIALRGREGVDGGGGVIYDKSTRSRYFQMTWEATFETKDFLAKQHLVAGEVIHRAAEEYIGGLRAVGGKPGDFLLILSYPAQPPVVLSEPDLEGHINVFTKLIVSLPERAPDGITEDSTHSQDVKVASDKKPWS